MSIEIDHKRVLEALLRTVHHIADKDYQKKIWIRGEGPEVADFDETYCMFCDLGDPVLENYSSYGVTEKQYQVLSKFRDEFKIFSDDNDLPQLFIDTPEWTRITLMAKEVLDAFNYKK